MTISNAHAPALRLAPGPRPLPVLGNLPAFWRIWGRTGTEVHMKYVQRYGDIVHYEFPGRTVYLIRHPDDVKHVLVDNASNYEKGRGTRKMRNFLGNGLLTSEGDFWRRQRKLAQPAFHHKRLRDLITVMTDMTSETLRSWERPSSSKTPFNAAAEMMRLTLGIVSKTLFSVDVSGQAGAVGDALTVALEWTNRQLMTAFALPVRVPTPNNRRFLRAKRALDRVVYEIIEERRRTRRDAGDLLSMLMLAKDEETGESMSDEQLRDEVMTLVLAGHETTANALAWTLALLSKEPVVRRALEDEVARVLGQRAPTFDDLPKLVYTRMILEEAMRLYPPAWIFGRTALANDELRGYAIPKDSVVAVGVYYTHRHPNFWPNPEGFDPMRFSAEASAQRPKHAYLPFGGGPRVCIGNSFAIFEAQVILAMIAQRYRLDLVPGARLDLEPVVTLRPKYGVYVTAHPI